MTIRQRNSDINKTRACLGWAPKLPLEEGPSKIIAYFSRLLADEPAWAQSAAQ